MVIPHSDILFLFSSTENEKKYSFLFCTMFFLPLLNGFLNEIFLVIGFSSISTLVYVIIYALAFYIYFVTLIQRGRKTIGLFVTICVLLLCHMIIHPAVIGEMFNFTEGLSGIALSNFFILFFLGLSMFWISLVLDKSCLGIITQYCEKYSYFVIVLFLVTMILQFGSAYTFNYMTIAYNAMPSLLILMYCGFGEKKTVAKIFFVIGALFIFIGGCRGALLQLMIAAVIFFFVNGESVFKTKKLIIILLAFLMSIIVFFSFDQIMLLLGDLLKRYGFSSRLIDMFLGISMEGGAFHFDDRAILYELTIPAISVFGKGVFVYVERVGYPHNILIEFLLGFGYIFGSLLFIGLCIVVFKSYRIARHSDDRFLMIIWVSAFTTIFVKLMLSTSYLIDRPFWFYFSFMLFMIRIGRGRKHVQIYC